MSTNAISSLRAAVASTSDAALRAETLALLAVHLAQMGEFEEVNGIQSQLRGLLASEHHPRVSVRLMILDGVILYYSNNSSDSFDRVRRASVIAEAFGFEDLCAEAAVWHAHFAFNFESYGDLGRALTVALTNARFLSDSLRGRVCLTIADALQYLDGGLVSSSWYKLSRIFCRRARDHYMIASVEHNRLMFGLARYRVDRALGIQRSETERNWFLELSSVRALTDQFGGAALPELIDMCNLMASQLAGDFNGAIGALDRIVNANAATVCGMSDGLVAIERIWCSVMAGAAGFADAAEIVGLDRIGKLSQNDQLIALPYAADISEKLRLDFDEVQYQSMLLNARLYFDRSVAEMRHGVEVCWQFVPAIEALALKPDRTIVS